MAGYIKRSDLVTRNIGGETIIVPVEGHVGDLDCIYTLNEVASVVWQIIDDQHSLDQIAAELCDRYEVTLEQARRDVVDLIDSLREAGLVRHSGEAAGR
jgi:hypothetical protein